MADIFPTGYHVAKEGFRLLDLPKSKDSVVVVIGLGPVGLCAVTAASTLFGTVLATDPVAERRNKAAKHGAIAFQEDQLKEEVKRITDGRGADCVLEVVGLPSALDLALELVRPWGAISSCGVYNDQLSLHGSDLYDKNIRLQFGRSPVRGLFEEALEVLRNAQAVFSDFIEHEVPLSQAAEYYQLFNSNKIGKTIFIPGT